MHIILIQVTFKPLALKGLPENFVAALRDGRNNKGKKSLIGTVQKSLAYGLIYFNTYPNLYISLSHVNSLDAFYIKYQILRV